MALSQNDRIAISKKIVAIPLENVAADNTKLELAKAKVELDTQDSANKSVIENTYNVLIDAYQPELNRYDGNLRTTLTEQIFLDSVNRVKNNPFFPNDAQLPLPSLPGGVWVNFIPFSGTHAIGKQFDETYATTAKEQDLIDAVAAAIAVVEGFSDPTRSTGEKCGATGTCSLPAYTTQATCTGNGGVWTPGSDLIETDNDMQAAGTDLINAVQVWEDFLNGTYAVVPTTDTEIVRSAQNDASRADITNAVTQIDSWQLLPDYDTTHGQSLCSSFNSMDVGLLDQTKFRADSIAILTAEIAARQAFMSTRAAQITSHLGAISQDTATGDVISATGFYGNRFRFIDIRLNGIAGSLSKLKGLERGEAAQEQMKSANNNAAAAYDSLLKATSLRAPGSNTKNIHVLDPTGFNVSDLVYIVSDTQEEIQATIDQIDGNRIVLNTVVPEKYRHTEFARLYKEL